jgi:hypothetical protein
MLSTETAVVPTVLYCMIPDNLCYLRVSSPRHVTPPRGLDTSRGIAHIRAP